MPWRFVFDDLINLFFFLLLIKYGILKKSEISDAI